MSVIVQPSQTDIFDVSRARALQIALGHPPTMESGDILPPFYHQIYFWDPRPPAQLGNDGHPKISDIIPDADKFQRIWVAGKLTYHKPLLAGTRAERISTVETIQHKEGKAGPYVAMRIRHDIKQRQTLALTEWQDIEFVQRRSQPDTRLAPTGETSQHVANIDAMTLFRYSALTLCEHRIHYDETYARNIEGYEGLVVHVPLIASLLMQFADAQQGAFSSFSYRAISPLTADKKTVLCCKDQNYWAKTDDGNLVMLAEAR